MWESGGGRAVEQGGVRTVEIVVMEVELEESGAVVTGVVRASISPLAGDGLDEAFGLAVGLGSVGSGETMLETELVTSLGKELGAISRAAIGEDVLDVDAMSLIEGDGLVECGQDTGGLFVWEERGKSEA